MTFVYLIVHLHEAVTAVKKVICLLYIMTTPCPLHLFFSLEQSTYSLCSQPAWALVVLSAFTLILFQTQHLCTAEFREILYKIYIVLIFFLEIVLLKIVQSACLYSDCSYFLTSLMPTFLEVGIVLCLRGVHVSSFRSAYELVNASTCAR